ncbi:MAG: thrombospondin type 3 repeat-containing protein [Candidatus Altiarchaeota archaeon]|nr:thrombospondin type 3 repeat-containing protein [Candidatus Altiarchaeota archaeon]
MVERMYLVFFVTTLIIVSGCLWETQPATADEKIQESDDEYIKQYLEEQKTPEKKTTTSIKQTTISSTTTTLACPHECCDEVKYSVKKCSKYLVCVNNTCVEPPCPHQCCVLGLYQYKPCNEEVECIDYKCQKQQCPLGYECCSQEEYNGGKCSEGFECINHLCVGKDSDNDGLEDVVEANYGSNPNLKDTDSDGLSDFDEVRVYGTDPNIANTDGDRYIDSEDKKPLTPETAEVHISTSSDVTADTDAIDAIKRYLSYGDLPPSGDTKIFDIVSNIRYINNGTDYTNSVNHTYYVGITCINNTDIYRGPKKYNYVEPGLNLTNRSGLFEGRTLTEGNVTETNYKIKEINYAVGRVDASVRYIRRVTEGVYVSDLTNATMHAIKQYPRCQPYTEIRSVEYEHYP